VSIVDERASPLALHPQINESAVFQLILTKGSVVERGIDGHLQVGLACK
jgi:hypothetical protein